jgi:hypothetical protein
MKATKEQIRQWLDMQIGAKAIQCQELALTPRRRLINMSRCDYIHINSEALRAVAKELEFPVVVIDKGEDVADYRYELQFYYNGVKFLAIETEKDYKKNGELA